MRLKSKSLLCAFILITAPTLVSAAEVLVWSDEFNGTSVDTNNWEFMIGTGAEFGLNGWGNNELQYYTSRSDNVFVANGMLNIVARQENFGGRNYTSARLRTLNKAEFLYGRIEARIKLPSTPGIWPAFWMLPTNSPYGGWAASGEMDIMESVNYADRIYGTIHYGGNWPNNVFTGGERENGIDYSADFHVYTLEWTPQFLRWYIDGTPFYTRVPMNWFSTAAPGDPDAPFDVPFHLLLNVAVGGNFPGNPNGDSVFPQTMQVDWVRWYQQDETDPEPVLQTPFPNSSTPHAIPGIVEAENFDNGGPGIAYFDCDASNNGGDFRTDESVDIETSSENGFNIGWMCENEWLEYTVDVAATGSYQFSARVASDANGGTFRIEMDGTDVSGDVTFPGTGGWQNWITVTTDVDLEAGEQVMRFANRSFGEYNLNWFEFVQNTVACTKGDMNEDGSLNGADIEAFAATVIDPGSASAIAACAADVDDSGDVDATADLAGFVALLLN